MKQLFYLLAFVLLNPQTFIAQPDTFTAMGTGGGGALFAPSISPFNNDELYLVCDMAGVFHSSNAGAAWELFHYEDLTSTNRSQMQFTSDPNVLYTLRSRVGSLYRLYPVKSTDGGATWNDLTDPDESLFWYLYAAPNHTERLVIGTFDGVWISTDGGDSFDEIFHDNQESLYVGGAFWDGDNIFVATNRGLLVSTDGGVNFDLDNTAGLPTNAGFFDFTGAKQDGVTRLFATCVNGNDLFPESEIYFINPDNLFGLFQIEWGTTNWSQVNGFPTGTIPYLVDMPIDDFGSIYSVGLTADDRPNVFKSTNIGNSWTNTFLTENNENITTGYAGEFGDFSWFWGGGAVAMDVSDKNGDIVAVTDFGFAHITQNGGDSWRQMYVTPTDENPAGMSTPEAQFYQSSGLVQTSCHDILWLNEQEIFVAYTDIGSQYSNDGGESWTFARAGIEESNWYKFAQHPTNNTLFAGVSELNDLFLHYRLSDEDIDNSNGRIVFSTNDGEDWQELFDFNHPVPYLTIDPANPNIMYASVCHSTEGGIYKTTNGGTSWTHLPDPPRTEGHPNNIRLLSNGNLVVSFSGRDPNGDDNYTQSSGVFLSTDGGNSWQDRSDADMMFYTQDIAIAPQNESIWYATVFDHFDNGLVENGGLYRTTDSGENWTRIHQFGQTHSAAVHPQNADIVYVTHEGGGLYYSENATATMPVFTQVESYPYLRPKRVFFNPFDVDEIWVTTMGGAVWQGSTDPNSTSSLPLANDLLQISNHPNPFSETTLLSFKLPESSAVQLKIFNTKGHFIKEIKGYFQKGNQQLLIQKEDLNAAGIYFYQLIFEGGMATGKLVFNN